ncbi:MAG: 4-alpha-glucanotransferase [Bacteroidetes bacterium]|nr:4-alpha-glucanotransferase [Bacteroidota bacterium]MBS1973575.1 4-alpha-glucanotransferase [Bacteroidota bacterium]
MRIQFYLRFHTKFGEAIYVSGNVDALGNNNTSKALPLQYASSEFWQATIELSDGHIGDIHYSYLFRQQDGAFIREWGNDRVMPLSKHGIEEVQVFDTWNHAGEFENAFFSSPFQQTLLKHNKSAFKAKSVHDCTHIFKVKAPLLRKDEVLCMTGSGKALKNWNTDAPLLMAIEDNWWSAKLSLPKESFPLHYKYGIFNTKQKKFVRFEEGENRLLYGDAHKKKLTIIHDGFAHLPNNTWHGAGVAIPVFSLRSKSSFGIGEFADIKLLVDWAKKTGLKLIQVLPVNDTTATHTFLDSYPYAAISAFALHPVYVNLQKVAGKKYAEIIRPLSKKQKQLNELAGVDYEQVLKFKLSALHELYLIQKDEFLEDEEYKEFFDKNKHWLIPYAAFSYLRDRNSTPDFSAWQLYSEYNKASIHKYVSPKAKHHDSIAVHYFIQYHLHLQLREATGYAHKNGIILKGDVPIGIYRNSCDAWVSPKLYHMDAQAGAPPDDFAVKGQNWGFPTYSWEEMAKDGFDWWKKRFGQMSNYFDAFRIDHILGFFRIWSIPMSSIEGVMGHFVPAHPVHINEFSERNIPFNYHRYTKPFINDAVLWEFFQGDFEYVKSQFLQLNKDGLYHLKQGFETQREVELHFAPLEQNEFNQKLKSGLFNLISNVILFEQEGSNGKQFHFRIQMDRTPSYRYMEWDKSRLYDLYIDYYYRRQDNFWREEAMKKLPVLKAATNMLVCGEDLGMVPSCVPDVMSRLGILSLEIQRMPKGNTKKEFFHPADAGYLSVVTPSTHDMSTIRGWWEEDRNKTQRFYNAELGQWGEAPFFCEPWINKAIIIQHLFSPAMWSIFQLQDLLGMSETIRRENPHDERINIPSDPKHYWKYRMHLTLEDLIKQKDFNEELKSYVETSGRA